MIALIVMSGVIMIFPPLAQKAVQSIEIKRNSHATRLFKVFRLLP
jgi:hypothetical protein